MKSITICWNDLTEKKQNEIADIIGDEPGCVDTPIAIIDIEEEC